MLKLTKRFYKGLNKGYFALRSIIQLKQLRSPPVIAGSRNENLETSRISAETHCNHAKIILKI